MTRFFRNSINSLVATSSWINDPQFFMQDSRTWNYKQVPTYNYKKMWGKNLQKVLLKNYSCSCFTFLLHFYIYKICLMMKHIYFSLPPQAPPPPQKIYSSGNPDQYNPIFFLPSLTFLFRKVNIHFCTR